MRSNKKFLIVLMIILTLQSTVSADDMKTERSGDYIKQGNKLGIPIALLSFSYGGFFDFDALYHKINQTKDRYNDRLLIEKYYRIRAEGEILLEKMSFGVEWSRSTYKESHLMERLIIDAGVPDKKECSSESYSSHRFGILLHRVIGNDFRLAPILGGRRLVRLSDNLYFRGKAFINPFAYFADWHDNSLIKTSNKRLSGRNFFLHQRGWQVCIGYCLLDNLIAEVGVADDDGTELNFHIVFYY